MLEVVGQFRLHYKGQAQGTLGGLVAMPSNYPSTVYTICSQA